MDEDDGQVFGYRVEIIAGGVAEFGELGVGGVVQRQGGTALILDRRSRHVGLIARDHALIDGQTSGVVDAETSPR